MSLLISQRFRIDTTRIPPGELAQELELKHPSPPDTTTSSKNKKSKKNSTTENKPLFKQTPTTIPPNNPTNKDYLTLAQKAKEKGNTLYRQGENYRAAAYAYRRCLHHMRRLSNRNELEKTLRIPCYANITACDLALERYEQAIRHASKIINSLDDKHVKSYFRRAEAYRHEGFLDKACKDLQKAHQLAPLDQTIQQAYDSLVIKMEQDKKKEREMAQRMFQ
jgi:tetratricopeptide (TPR) repeat protein